MLMRSDGGGDDVMAKRVSMEERDDLPTVLQ